MVMPYKDDLPALYETWLDFQEPHVRAVAERFRPWRLYKMAETEQIVSWEACADDGTIRVHIEPKYNSELDVRTGMSVFGVNPDDLVEWMPPLDG